MSRREIPLKGGAEYDALTRAKRFHGFAPGERKKIKRGFNKRVRAFVRAIIQDRGRWFI